MVCTKYSCLSPCCARLFIRSAQVYRELIHFASSVHSFLLPSAPQISAPDPGSWSCRAGPGSGGEGGGGGEIHSQRIVGIGSETFFGDNVIRRAVVTRRVVKLIVKIGSIVRFQLLAPEGPMLAYLHLYLGTELAFRTVTQTGRVIESI